MLAATVQHVIDAVPKLNRVAAVEAVMQATGHARPLRELHDHVTSHPDALTSGSADQVPPSLIRLVRLLAEQGFAEVRMLACLHCGRTDRALPGRIPGGRLCQPCAHKATAKPCSACGRVRPVHALTKQRAPLCDGCAGRPRRVCGNCGKTAKVGRRATATTPDLCQQCNQTKVGPCAICGKTKRCRKVSGGRLICPACQAAARVPTHACCRCGRLRPVQAHWLAGPVCGICYERALTTPRPCNQCGRRAVLTGTGDNGAEICGTCAGSTRTYDCPDCGQPCRPFAGGRCARQVLTERVHQLLPADTRPDLAELATALVTADDPRAVLRWLNGPTGKLLTELSRSDQPLTHAVLDAVPDNPGLRYLRSLLVATNTLPHRDDYLERVAGRIDEQLTGHSAHHAMLVRRYALWDVMARARRRRERTSRPSTSATSQHLRQKIRLALDFLNWLDQHTVGLEKLTQSDLERYLTERNTTLPLEGFITWLRRQHLIGDVRFSRRSKTARPSPIPERDRWDLLQRCLHDQQIPLHVRVAGALLLLYGNPVTHTVALSSEALDQRGERGEHHYLTLAYRPVLLPPLLASLLQQLRDQATPASTLGRAVDPPSWLFPGRQPGTHRNGPGFTTVLAAHGISVRPARTAALMALAEQLPAAVLGPLLGLHPHTAAAWTSLVKRDWNDYIAARAMTTRTTSRLALQDD